MLGWVQQVSDRPEQVSSRDTQFCGVVAFLLAGSAVHELYAPGRRSDAKVKSGRREEEPLATRVGR
jgi:hypothetical protein